MKGETMKENTKELLQYSIVGIGTTLINYIIYYSCIKLNSNWMISNSIAWIFAVLFAFYTNKKYVFKSTGDIKNEMVCFFTMRIFTLIIENTLLFVFIQAIGYHHMISKIIVSVVTVVFNYILCKFKIFRNEGVCHG